MDPSVVVAFLAPLVPHLLRGLKSGAGEAAEKLGREVWDQAEHLWQRIRDRISGRPEVPEIVDEIARDPHDQLAQAALARELRNAMAADPSFAAEIEDLWNRLQATGPAQVRQVTASGAGAVAIGGDVDTSHITTHASGTPPSTRGTGDTA